MAIVYKLTNKINGKCYVGRTVHTLDERWKGHVGSAIREDNGMMIARAIKKYGFDSFDREVIEECTDNQVVDREMYWIEKLGTHVTNGGYNLTLGGDGGILGHRFSDESKEKMRQRAFGRKHSDITKAKMSASKLGKSQDPLHVAKRAEANRGKKRTDEQRISMSLAQLTSGYTHSEETRRKIGEKSRNRVISDETRKKCSVAHLGKEIHTDEYKARVGERFSRPVTLIECGAVVDEFSSVKSASIATGFSCVTISRRLSDGLESSGFNWQYLPKKDESVQ